MSETGFVWLYPLILKTYSRKFNWGYRYGNDDIPFIQQSFLYSMLLLHEHGNVWKPFLIYQDYSLQAFPIFIHEGNSTPYRSAEDEIRDCFDMRALNRFLHFMGLANIEQIPNDKPISRQYRIRNFHNWVKSYVFLIDNH